MSLSRLDPRVKLFFLIAVSTTALIVRTPAALTALLLISILVILAGGVTPVKVWGKLRGLIILIVMLFALQCIFSRGGEPLFTILGVTIVTRSGFRYAAIVCLRLLIIVFSAMIVISGDARDFLLAMTECKIPYEIAFMVLAALRFLPMLREEASDVLCAARMRGLRLKKEGLRIQAGAYISIVIPVVAGAIRRAEQLSVAMEARGFRALPQRTSMRGLNMRAADWAYSVLLCIILAALMFLAFSDFSGSMWFF